MAKFIFSMNSILELKMKLEDQEKIYYGNARLKLTEEEDKLQALVDRKSVYEMKYKSLIQSVLKIQEIRSMEQSIDIMKDKIKIQQKVVENAEKALEIARVRLNQAMIERKTYEILKEKAFEQFKRELEEVEQKEIDELVSFKFNSSAGDEEVQ